MLKSSVRRCRFASLFECLPYVYTHVLYSHALDALLVLLDRNRGGRDTCRKTHTLSLTRKHAYNRGALYNKDFKLSFAVGIRLVKRIAVAGCRLGIAHNRADPIPLNYNTRPVVSYLKPC